MNNIVSVSRQSLVSNINRLSAAPGPVSITIETPGSSIPLSPSLGPSLGPSLSPSLGGVLVANEQVLGAPCLAR